MTVSLDAQLACAKRELAMRRGYYPKRVASGAMSQAAMDPEIAAMEAIVATLEKVKRLKNLENPMAGLRDAQ